MIKKLALLCLLSCSASYAQVADSVITFNLTKFYTWYIQKSNKNEDVGFWPRVVEGEKKKALLDVPAYCENLRKSGFFSSHFIANEFSRFEPCERELAEMKWSKFNVEGEIPEYPSECTYFTSDFWFQAQDVPNRIIIREVSPIDERHAQVIFVFDAGTEDAPYIWPSTGTATMFEENDEWLIDKIAFNVK